MACISHRRALAAAIAVGVGVSCAAVSAAQTRKPVTNAPVKAVQPTVPPEWLPDLVVVSADATAVCTAKGTVTATVVAKVRNQGSKGTADLSKTPFHIVVEVSEWWSTSGPINLEQPPGQTIKPQVGGPTTLKPGESWTGTLVIAGMPKFKKNPTNAPQYGFVVRADPLKAVAEADESNNEKLAYAPDPCAKS
jgi:hypothetical protein